MHYIHREIEGALRRYLAAFPSVAVTGPRQSGKSTLLINSLEGYTYLTLDDPLRREQALSDPQFFLDSAGEKAIIDEIQLAPSLLSYVKMRIDAQRDVKGRYVFTGSQQFNMIRNLSDSLAGRVGLLDLLPFSVAEKKAVSAPRDAVEAFVHACLTGSFPEIVIDANVDRPAWYGSYVQTYLERDVRTLYNIGNLRDFQRFVRLLATRCSQVLNMSQFANDLGISTPTVRNWLSVLEAGRIIYLLPPYFNNLGKRVTKSPKVYFLDCGLVCYLTGINDRDHLLKGPMAGPLFENFCIQETVKLFFNGGMQPPLYYLRTNNNLEVDLLVEEAAGKLTPFEIKLGKTPSVAMASNIERFRKTFGNLDIGDGAVVCLADTSVPLARGVSALTFDDYLERLRRLFTAPT